MELEYKRLKNWPGLEIKKGTGNAYATKKHLHQELSLGYVMKGSTNLSIGHKKLFIQEGEGIIIPPFYVHQCEPIDINRWQFKMIYLTKSFLSEGMSHLSNYMKEPRILNVNQVSFLIEWEKILNDLDDKLDEGVKRALKEGLMEVIAGQIDEQKLCNRSPFISEAYNYIKMNFLQDIPLELLEELFHISKYHLIRQFKRQYNSTPYAYQLQLRVNHGKKLLSEGLDVVLAAHEAGFYDQAHFNQEFKKAVGLTPQRYKKSILYKS